MSPPTPEEWSEVAPGGHERSIPPDRTIAQLAERQHGVVSRRQLAAAGMTRKMIRHRVDNGRLLPLHRGVYAVGHKRLRREGFVLAAVLAVGDRAVLSHRDAGWLHGVLRGEFAKVDVTTPGRPAAHDRIRVHARRPLDARDVTHAEGIPVTTVARTLVDLADVLPRHRLAKALSEAERLRVLDVRRIAGALERTRGRQGRGHEALAAALGELARIGVQVTRSELEDRFRALIAAAGLPRPRLNAHVEGVEVDAYWARQRLVVELDGYEYHRHRQAWVNDHEKTNALKDLGYDVRRYTYGDVVHSPRRTAARLTRALGA